MASTFRPSESQRHSYGQSAPGNAGFSVAGMPPMGSSQLSSSTWGASAPGASFGGSLSDSLSQSRPHYTSGYLMSASQSSTSQGTGRHDDVPTVQTRAKLNNPLSRLAASEFGMESMFQAPKQRPVLMDEDAPPTSSVNDIVNEYPSTQQGSRRPAFAQTNARSTRAEHMQSPSTQLIYVVVFGYPADRYAATVEFFRSLGDTATEADPHAEIINAFRIGFRNPTEAIRAMRKNGEVIGGSWMIGVKWADPSQAESVLGSAVMYSLPGGISTPAMGASIPSSGPEMNMEQDIIAGPGGGALVTTSLGTPLKLAPSSAAFRKPGGGAQPPAHTGTGAPADSAGLNKSVFGQVSDMIFGW